MNGNLLDGLRRRFRSVPQAYLPPRTRILSTQQGSVRVFDSGPTGGGATTVVMVPDGPCSIEHHAALAEMLETRGLRVVCFDLPGFGFSFPAGHYDHSLAACTDAMLDVMDQLELERSTLAFTCANGYYALALAKRAPKRVAGLVLAQTPSLSGMQAWAERTIWPILNVPFLGQALMAAGARPIAKRWFEAALPRGADVRVYQSTADRALRDGACFCLAGVAQAFRRVNAAELRVENMPAMLVYGDRDRTHRTTKFEELREHLPGVDFIRFEGCGHFPHLERAEAFAEHVVRAARAAA